MGRSAMRVLILTILLFSGALAQKSLEERVFDDIELMWRLIPKDFVADAATYFDLNTFFSKYDQDNADEWGVDENEFAVGFAADIGCTETEARAFFKKFDFSRFDLDFLPFEEVIDDYDTAYALEYMDINLDGVLERNEFELGFGFAASDLPWGVMFMNYRTLVTQPPYYDDHLSYNLAPAGDPQLGDWHKLFDDIDANNDNTLVEAEFIEFYVGRGYGTEETAIRWFNAGNILEDGFIDRTFEWTTLFTNLNQDTFTEELSFDEFVELDWYVRPIALEGRETRKEWFSKLKYRN